MNSVFLLALAPFIFPNVALSQSCSPLSGIQLTYYGFPDGKSDTTALTCAPGVAHAAGGKAGGKGTYEDPMTFATKAGSANFQECEVIYVPYTKKYYIYGDHCAACDDNHIDLWIGTSNDGGEAQLDCERQLGTQAGQQIVKNPPNSLEVVEQNLWDGTCHADQGSTIFPNADTAQLCSGGGGGGGGGESSAPPSSGILPVGAPTGILPPRASPPVVSPLVAPPPAALSPPSTFSTLVVPSNGNLGLGNGAGAGTGTETAAASPSSTGATGGRIGHKCQTFSDCAGELICVAEKCRSDKN